MVLGAVLIAAIVNRLGAAVGTPAVVVTIIGWNVKNLTRIDAVGIRQVIHFGDIVGIHSVHATNFKKRVAITNRIVVASGSRSDRYGQH
jgi:hypothetical protein